LTNAPHRWYNLIIVGGDRVTEQNNLKEPFLRFQKKADKEKNRVIIPKTFIEKWGDKFYMDVYSDKIVLRPIGKE